jgi:hypothetical protein
MPESRARKQPTRNDRRRVDVARRRHAATAAAKAQQRRRRRLAVGGAAVAVLVIGGALAATLVATGGDEDSPDAELTGEVVETSDDSPLTVTGPDAYRVQYQSDAYEGRDLTSTTMTFNVQRPFDATVDSKVGVPPGSDLQWAVTSNLGLYADTSEGTTTVSAALPQPALGDLRLDATLPDLVAKELFLPRERRELLGRECQVYRTGAPVETFSIAFPTNTTYSDVCIDAAGLMLEEVSVTNGAVTGRMTASEIATEPTLDEGIFSIDEQPVGLADGAFELQPLDAAAPTADGTAGAWAFPDVPEGYELQGRYKLLQPAPAPADETATTDATDTTVAADAPPLESYVDVYVDGTNLVVLLQGPVAAEPSAESVAAETVDLGALGQANVTAGLSTSTLLTHPTDTAGWFVQLGGTVAVATLEELARTLTAS